MATILDPDRLGAGSVALPRAEGRGRAALPSRTQPFCKDGGLGACGSQ